MIASEWGKRCFQQTVLASFRCSFIWTFRFIPLFHVLPLELLQMWRKFCSKATIELSDWSTSNLITIKPQITRNVHSVSRGVDVTRAWNCASFETTSTHHFSLSRYYQQTSAAAEESELEKHQGLLWLPAVSVETQLAWQLNLITAGDFVQVCFCVCLSLFFVATKYPAVSFFLEGINMYQMRGRRKMDVFASRRQQQHTTMQSLAWV